MQARYATYLVSKRLFSGMYTVLTEHGWMTAIPRRWFRRTSKYTFPGLYTEREEDFLSGWCPILRATKSAHCVLHCLGKNILRILNNAAIAASSSENYPNHTVQTGYFNNHQQEKERKEAFDTPMISWLPQVLELMKRHVTRFLDTRLTFC